MKLQQPPSPISLLHPHANDPSSTGTSFKSKLPTYLKEINLKTTALSQDHPLPTNSPKSISKSISFDSQKNKIKSEISTMLETSHKLYLFLGRTVVDNYSEIVVYEYKKEDGAHVSMEMTGLKGVVMTMKARYCPRRKPLNRNKDPQPQQQKSTKRSQSTKNPQENLLQVVLFLGTTTGQLKTLRFNPTQTFTLQNRTSTQSLKLDYTSIVDTVVLDPSYYSKANVCLALSQTNKVYLVNFDLMVVLAVFMPTVMSCEVGLGLSVNQERRYFVQACEGGYVIFWNLDEHILKLIDDSNPAKGDNETLIQTKKQTMSSKVTIQKAEDDDQPFNQPPLTFKPSSIHHNIIPICIFHSATITGLKFCQLYGNLLLLVTQGGMVKLIALNQASFSHINENEYCTLIEYQVQQGELITDVKFFPDTMEIFLVKNAALDGVLVKSGEERYIYVKEFQLEQLNNKSSKKHKNNPPSSTDPSSPYRPQIMKEIKRNLKSTQRPRSKSLDNRLTKCYFERIVFNSELEIEKVDKIYPSIYMDCIDALEITEMKDIMVLRGKEFYLIGTTDLFRAVDLG